MINGARLVFIWAIFFSLPAAWGQTPQLEREDGDKEKEVPLDIFEIESAYVFESNLNHGGSVGKQDALQNEIEYGHRISLTGNWYAHLGVAYQRLDFGNTSAPVPIHLQSGAAVVGVDYMKGSDVGAFIEFRPGFYTEEHVGLASFDCPITVARFFILQEDKLYLLVGANGSFLRGYFPVIPLAGVVWVPSDTIRVMAIPPEPRIVYAPNDKLNIWVGGEIAGGSFRTDNEDTIVPAKLSGAVVDYIDYRAGVGLIYAPNNQFSVDLGAGCSIERSYNFKRADEFYRTDPAPYVWLEVKAKF
jgi:hypothetical protein